MLDSYRPQVRRLPALLVTLGAVTVLSASLTGPSSAIAVTAKAKVSAALPAAATLGYTGKQAHYTVPADVELLRTEVQGGTGGTNNNYYYGATLEGYLKVQPRQALYADVGGAGSPGGGATFGGGAAAGNDEGAMGSGDPAWSGGGGSGAASMFEPTPVAVTGGKVYPGQAANSINPVGALVPAGGGGATGGGSGGYFGTCLVGNPPDQISFGDSNPGAAGSGSAGGAGGSATLAAGGFITGAGGGGGGGYYGGGGGPSGVIGCVPQCSSASGGSGGGAGSSFASTRLLLPTPLDQAGPASVTLTPAVTVRVPASGARYRRGARLRAAYACLKALAYSCKGTVATRARIATSKLGAHSFDVTIVVSSGAARKRVTVAVRYVVVK